MSITYLARKNGELELLLYGDIGAPPLTSADVANLLDANKDAKVIRCRISSRGGDAFEGITIHNLLAKHSARVEVEIDGQASSAASIIAMAGDHVQIASNSLVMIHQAWDGGGPYKVADHLSAAECLSKINNNAAQMYAAKSKKTVEQISTLMENDKWLTAQEALEIGLVDEVVESKKVAAKVRGFLSANIDKTLADLKLADDAEPTEPKPDGEEPKSEGADDSIGDSVIDAFAQDTGLDKAAVVALLQDCRDEVSKLLNDKIDRDGTPSEAKRDDEMPHDDEEEDPEMSLKLTMAMRMVDELKGKVTALEADKQARDDQALDAEIDAMTTAGYLLEAEKPKARALLQKDPAAFRELFSSRKVPARQTEVTPERKPGELPKLEELPERTRSLVKSFMRAGIYTDQTKAIAKAIEQERN